MVGQSEGLKTVARPGSVPVPDPTTLTNELVHAAVTAAVERLEARMNGTDTLNIEKFSGIESRFKLEGEAKVKAAADVKSAVDAAFAAAKDGVTQQNQANFLASQKQEAAFTKQIDQLTAIVAQTAKANDDKLNDLKKTNDDKFNDLKDRLVAMEGRTSISDPTTAAALRDMANSITALKSSSDVGSGRRVQGSESMALILSIVAAVAAVGIVIVDWVAFAGRAHG
jgi:hypothetical protein